MALPPAIWKNESSKHFWPAVLNVCPCAATESISHLPSSSSVLKFEPVAIATALFAAASFLKEKTIKLPPSKDCFTFSASLSSQNSPIGPSAYLPVPMLLKA